MKEELYNTVLRFLETFEDVFDKDWEYSKEMLGIQEETTEQKRNAKEMGLETIEVISSDGTFLNPKNDSEIEDWGYRGKLLKEYRILKEIISNRESL